MTQDEILGLLRHLLTTAGGGLIANGWVNSDQWSQIVGGLVTLGTVGWSVWQKKQAQAKLTAAIAAPAGKATP